MKTRLIIGAILAIAAAVRLLILCGLIPVEPHISEEYVYTFEPYLSAVVILFLGAFLFYDSYKNLKK